MPAHGQEPWPFRPLTFTRRTRHDHRVTCEECGQEATGRAEGWEAHLVDLDDDGQDEVVFYCAERAEREFHTTR